MGRRVIVVGPLPPPYGGVSVYVNALRVHLAGLGVRLWAYGSGSAPDSSVRLFNHRKLGIIRLLLSEGRRARILDITHHHFEYPNALLLPLWLVFKWLLRFEWHKNVHDGTLPARHRGFGLAQRLLFRLAARSIDSFIVVSEDLKRWLQDEIKVRQQVTVIPCLLPVARQTAVAALPAGVAEALAAYRQRPRRVCSIGAFIPNYGFKHIADAVETLRQQTGEDIGLALVAGTFAGDEDYRAQVLRRRDWITVVENAPNPAVYQILKASNVFVRATGQESYGISRVEAIWCGLPVVATPVGETRGMLLYDFGDEKGLARQLERALFHPPVQDVQRWAAQFRREAETNLQSLKEALGISACVDGRKGVS
jgi:glycosyltransferase involved in cell wall biosynthesis